MAYYIGRTTHEFEMAIWRDKFSSDHSHRNLGIASEIICKTVEQYHAFVRSRAEDWIPGDKVKFTNPPCDMGDLTFKVMEKTYDEDDENPDRRILVLQGEFGDDSDEGRLITRVNEQSILPFALKHWDCYEEGTLK